MFLRSIFYPSLLACAIGVPMLYSSVGQQSAQNYSNGGFQNVGFARAGNGYRQTDGHSGAGFLDRVHSLPNLGGVTVIPPADANAYVSNQRHEPVQSQNAPLGQLVTPASTGQSLIVSNPASIAADPRMMLPTGSSMVPGQLVAGPNSVGGAMIADPALLGMTPDYGAAETFVLPGNAHGPDLTATPLDDIPVTDFSEIIRFDVFPNWVKSRWKRVSTNPGGAGLHGLRVAVVTGTNSWDLHGSLTYYFDANQRAQRITFRGWTGDSSRLVNLLTSRYGLRAQPTHWAGAYVAQDKRGTPSSGLLMQHPAVIDRDNPVQQLALVMELNHPGGSFKLSEEFLGQLRYALQGN